MKLLVLEDEEDTRKLLEMSLSREGFDVECHGSSISALCAFLDAFGSGKPFEALILDCAIADFDGFTVAKTVRLWEANSRKLQRTKIAFYTAYSKTVEQSTLLDEVGADAYFRKPSDSDRLPQLVADWLRKQ